MQVNVITKTIINRDLKTVFDFSSQPDNVPKWYVKINSVEWITSRPLRVGSKIKFRATFLFKKLEYTYVVSELIDSKKLIMKTFEGPFPMETTYQWLELDDSNTLMILQNKGEPKGFSKFLSPIMSFAMRRAQHQDLKKLKEILEKI